MSGEVERSTALRMSCEACWSSSCRSGFGEEEGVVSRDEEDQRFGVPGRDGGGDSKGRYTDLFTGERESSCPSVGVGRRAIPLLLPGLPPLLPGLGEYFAIQLRLDRELFSREAILRGIGAIGCGGKEEDSTVPP